MSQHFSDDRKNTIILQCIPIPRIWFLSEKMQKPFKVVWIKRQEFLNQSNSLSPPSAKNTPGEEASRTHPSEPEALPGQCGPFYCIDARQLCEPSHHVLTDKMSWDSNSTSQMNSVLWSLQLCPWPEQISGTWLVHHCNSHLSIWS